MRLCVLLFFGLFFLIQPSPAVCAAESSLPQPVKAMCFQSAGTRKFLQVPAPETAETVRLLSVQAEEPALTGETAGSADDSTEEEQGTAKIRPSEDWIGGQLMNELELEEIEQSLADILGTEKFSFRETVLALIKGEIPFDGEELVSLAVSALLDEVRQQRRLILQILFVVLTSAVFSNFTMIFHSSQIADIGFYMMYLLLAVILMQSFGIMNGIACSTVRSLISLMRVLLPAYLLTIMFCAGSLTVTGASEILLFSFTLLEMFMVNVMIPAVNFYLVLQILNQMSREDYFSKFAELLELIISWGIKSVFGIVIGLQTVQCLITPAVDSLKNGMLQKAARAIPGLGNTLDAAAETIAGSAVVIKNAVGTAGMAAILFLCLVPVTKLVCCILMLRVLCALVQPAGENRLVESVSHVAGAASMLLRIILYSMGIFMVSIAMIMASVRGRGGI